jgi:hypothetical protein
VFELRLLEAAKHDAVRTWSGWFITYNVEYRRAGIFRNRKGSMVGLSFRGLSGGPKRTIDRTFSLCFKLADLGHI